MNSYFLREDGGKSPRQKSPDRGGSIAEAFSVTEHLERQQEIKATSVQGHNGRFWTHTTTWSGKVTEQTRDHQSRGGEKDGGKERGKEGKVINRLHWGRVCGSDVTGGRNLSDVL